MSKILSSTGQDKRIKDTKNASPIPSQHTRIINLLVQTHHHIFMSPSPAPIYICVCVFSFFSALVCKSRFHGQNYPGHGRDEGDWEGGCGEVREVGREVGVGGEG
ncbi:hypothetical protein ACMFMG_005979 [Clarireedia jacksonii]